MKTAVSAILAVWVFAQPSWAQCQNKARESALLRPGVSAEIVINYDSDHAETAKKKSWKLTLMVRSLNRSGNNEFSIQLGFGCSGKCVINGREQDEKIQIGNVSIFPNLEFGETRRLELILDAAEVPNNADRLSVTLSPILTGQKNTNQFLKIEDATLM